MGTEYNKMRGGFHLAFFQHKNSPYSFECGVLIAHLIAVMQTQKSPWIAPRGLIV